jgi:hypothetical protein
MFTIIAQKMLRANENPADQIYGLRGWCQIADTPFVFVSREGLLAPWTKATMSTIATTANTTRINMGFSSPDGCDEIV